MQLLRPPREPVPATRSWTAEDDFVTEACHE